MKGKGSLIITFPQGSTGYSKGTRYIYASIKNARLFKNFDVSKVFTQHTKFFMVSEMRKLSENKSKKCFTKYRGF